MDETVFFNPADSIGNFHDHNDAVRTAQIYKEKDDANKRVLVVHGVNNKSFDIFLADDQVTHTNELPASKKEYQVEDEI